MVNKKLTKKQLQEKQLLEDKKFRKHMIIGFSLLLMVAIVVLVFFLYWCDTKFFYRSYSLYGDEIPHNLICMNGNKLEHHESVQFIYNANVFYACSEKCKEHIFRHYDKVAFVADAFSGDTICKSDALIALKERGKPDIVYFKNMQNLKNYYAAKQEK